MRGASSTRLFQICLFLLYNAAAISDQQRAPTPLSIINLDKDTARWRSVTAELSGKGVPMDRVTRLPAVYGKDLSPAELQASASGIARHFCTAGMIGCYLSHRNFWQQTLEGAAPWQAVLEDDVQVSEDFCEKLEECVGELESHPETRGGNWEVLLLGALGCVHPQRKYKLNRINAFVAGGGRVTRRVTEHCHVPRRPFGTHAYVLSRRGAAKLLRRASLATGHVDAVAWGIADLQLLCCDPMLAHQAMEAPSTIGAITGGLEAWLPKFKVDEYTGVTFEWAFNEPCIRVPGLGVVLTIGRCLSIGLVGVALGLALIQRLPWVLPLHVAICSAMFVFLRIMITPQTGEGPWTPLLAALGDDLPAAVAAAATGSTAADGIAAADGAGSGGGGGGGGGGEGGNAAAVAAAKESTECEEGVESVGEDDTAQVSPPSTPPQPLPEEAPTTPVVAVV